MGRGLGWVLGHIGQGQGSMGRERPRCRQDDSKAPQISMMPKHIPLYQEHEDWVFRKTYRVCSKLSESI